MFIKSSIQRPKIVNPSGGYPRFISFFFELSFFRVIIFDPGLNFAYYVEIVFNLLLLYLWYDALMGKIY